MAESSKFKVFTKEVKTVKSRPSIVLKEHKVKDQEAVDKLVAKFKKSKEPYFEVHGFKKGRKMVYTKPQGVKNYTEKECRL